MKLPSIAVTATICSPVLSLLVSIGNIADAFTVPSSLGRHVGIDCNDYSAADARDHKDIGVAMRMGGGDFDYHRHDDNDPLTPPSPSLFFVEEDTDTDDVNTPYEPLTRSNAVAPRPPSVPPPASVLFQHEDHSTAGPREVDTASATASSSSSSAAAVPHVAKVSRSNGKSFERKSVVMASSVIDSTNDYRPSKSDVDIASAFERAQIAMETAYAGDAPAATATADSDNVEVDKRSKGLILALGINFCPSA